MIVLALIGVLALVLLVLAAGVVVREWRLFHAAERDRPAVLEGGGSHLQRPRRR